MTSISEIKNSERKKIQRRIQERLTKKGSKKSSSKRKTLKKSSIKSKKVNKIPPPSKKQINSQIRYIDNILSQENLHLDSNDKHKFYANEKLIIILIKNSFYG